MIFLDAEHYLSDAHEKDQYLLHENHVEDFGYRTFLNRLAAPLLEKIPDTSKGLDYGCGPGPALAAMCQEAGHEMALYDPFFAPDKTSLSAQYDFITCTEVAEHFHNPANEFQTLDRCLRPGSWLGVMTSFYDETIDFSKWHYPTDPTHVVFYGKASFEWLAQEMSWHLEFPAPNVVLFQK